MTARSTLGSGKRLDERPATRSWPLTLLIWLLREVRFLAGIVCEPTFAASLLIGLVLWSLVYQLPFATALHIGGDVVSHRREDDAPFLRGWNGSEPDVKGVDWWTLPPGYGYRWASPDASIDLPGVGGGRWLLRIAASSGRADGTATTSVWQSPLQQTTLTIAPEQRVYRVLADAAWTGDLTLHLRSPEYVPAIPDPRWLGFVVSRVEIAPAIPGLRLPAFGQLGWLLLVLAVLYSFGRRIGLARGDVFVLALAIVVGIGLLLLYQRLVVTIFTPTLATVLASCYLLTIALVAVARGWLSDPVAEPFDSERVSYRVPLLWSPIPLIVLAFALRIGGLFHPHTLINDIGLHANNLLGLTLGTRNGGVYFTEGLPSDAGGGQSPYPPGTYLLLLPFQLLMQPSMEHRIQLLNISVALMDSLVVGLLWLMLWRSGLGKRAAWCGAALYLTPPPLLGSFSIGEAANIGGQALALPVIALLALATPSKATWRLALSWLVPALCIALLAHMGVTISLACLLIALWAQVAMSRRWRPQLAKFTTCGLLAVVAVGIFYYSVPLFVEIFAGRLGGGATVTSSSGGAGWQRVLGRAGTLLTPGNRITPILTAMGLAGTFLVGVVVRSRALPLVLRSWWLGTVLSLALLLVAQQGVREQHFLYPALCLGAGPLLAAWWKRGRAGRIAAFTGLLLPIAIGILFWINQLADYLH